MVVPAGDTGQAEASAAPVLDTAGTAEIAAPAAATILAEKWTYNATTDPMTSRTSRTATIASENSVEFDFPYQGEQHARLIVRNDPSYGRDVMLQIERGQILCPSYQDCSVRVRFDEGAAERWTAAGADDGSSTVIFFRSHSRFVQRMRAAKVVRVQIPVYQEGQPTFEFQVGGFDHARYTSTK
jgi:hypothetical protein